VLLACTAAVVVVMWTVVLPQRSLSLHGFGERVGHPTGETTTFTDRSIVGALAYALAQVTDGTADDFWARTGDGHAYGSLTLHLPGGRAQTVAVDVIDLTSGRTGLAPCHAGTGCTITSLGDGQTLAVHVQRRGIAAVATDDSRHLHVDVQALGRLLSPDQVGAVARAGWWADGTPRSIVSASRWLRVHRVEVGYAVNRTGEAR
jgi:hypothetical protein